MVHQRDQTSFIRGRGGRLAGRGGRYGSSEHNNNMSTAVYSEALRSIMSVG